MQQDMNPSASRPAMTAEENEQVMKFLADLEKMETENPEQFAQVMAQLGVPGGDKGSEDSTAGGTTRSMVEAISQMRTSASQGMNMNSTNRDIQLPEGKTMSTGGVQMKKPKGIEITPEAGFVVKTRRLTDGLKVFINICKHDALAEPALKKKLDASGEEVEGMNIPLSVGPRRFDTDKSNVQCHVYDVIVNPTVIDDVREDITGKKRDFLCQLALQGLEQKYKEQLDKRYKLPKLKYLGDNVASQLIQDRKNQPVIEEINVPSSGKKEKAKPAPPPVAKKDEALSCELCWLREGEGEAGADGNLEPIASLQRDEHGGAPMYVPPLTAPEQGVTHILFTAHVDMAISGADLSSIQVKVSAYKLSVSVKGYKSVTFSLPAAVLPPSAASTQPAPPAARTFSVLRLVEGYTRLVQLRVGLALDHADWSEGPDPGSRPWLVAEALGGGAARAPSRPCAVQEEDNREGEDSLPEDKFHINLPEGVDKYTGRQLDYEEGAEEEVFAEDKFHRADASSQYIIEQRENDIRKKWEKHEKEKAERENDPNVEFVELDDYKAGGKYGPEKDPTSKAFDLNQSSRKQELQQASEVLAKVASMRGFDWSQEPDIAGGCEEEGEVSSAVPAGPMSGGLSSTLWTELLD